MNRLLKLAHPNTKLIGITGRARAGKTTFAKKLKLEYGKVGIKAEIYSADFRFKLCSQDRKKLIQSSFNGNIGDYIRSVQQSSWWDFSLIYYDLLSLYSGKPIEIKGAYDRTNGLKNQHIKIRSADIIIYESAILGDSKILDILDQILFIDTPGSLCLKESIETDSSRRSITEIASRFILTSYSENLFYNELFLRYKEKVSVINREGDTVQKDLDFESISFFPIPYCKSSI